MAAVCSHVLSHTVWRLCPAASLWHEGPVRRSAVPAGHAGDVLKMACCMHSVAHDSCAALPLRVWRAHGTACRPVADSPAALGARALYRRMVCSQRGGSCFESNVLFAWVLRHHLACQVDLLPALSCHSPHSPRHHHSPPSSSCRSSRQPP
ncbi:unnamed protein product, partial [Closterium sp. NIES-53]